MDITFRGIRRLGSDTKRVILFILILWTVAGLNSNAQYFGRNKPGYRNFKFNVIQTPHFEIYQYLRNDSLLDRLYQWTEKWYAIHQVTFRDTFKTRNPVIFYNNLPDFQQTNTISGLIGSGTGGVTESLKNRVIMPVAPTLSQTDHTLGHELVHAFQYHLFLNNATAGGYSIRNLPLWMIEGMAEYLSLGSVDPNTAMWMRDAIINDDFPTLKKLSSESRYFPYRYGHAFWAMAGKTWGDTIIIPLLKKTAQLGFEKAVDSLFRFNEETLSGMWKSAVKTHFSKYIKDKSDLMAGMKVISKDNGGRYNISPSISPDGKYIAFFSEKNLFTLDLFLADAKSGRIIKKLSSVIKNNDIDDFSFIESAGTWSPDSRKFAFIIFSKGVNKVAIIDLKKTRKVKELEMKGVPSVYNPSWSPDGKKLVFTGMRNGISDLYLYYFSSGSIEKLTDDMLSNIHPSWSPDGNYIVFSQEKMNDDTNQRRFSFSISILDLKQRTIQELDVFNGAFNMNPNFSQDGKSVYFLSDADGFRNLYRYGLESQTVYRMTDYITGISGITPYSPAISAAPGHDLIVYNYYYGNSYQIWIASESDFQLKQIDKGYLNLDAGTLPPLQHFAKDIVDSSVYNLSDIKRLSADSVKKVSYNPRFKLDYISNNASIGVSTGIYRDNMSGSINMIFSDILGNNQLYSSLSLNGEIYDFGGIAAYVNQKSKIKWGGALSHIPYRTGNMFAIPDTISYNESEVPVENLVLDYIRMFEDNISGFAYYPFSQNRRLEANFSLSWYYYRIDRFNNYYSPDGYYIGSNREKLDAPRGNNYQQVSLAYVEDNSFYGMTSPMQGHRLRYQVEKYFGVVDFYTALVDYRKYFYLKPFSLAFRAYHYGRYGKNVGDNITSPLYLGYPWLIRGYENISFSNDSYPGLNSFNVSRLSGERTVVANAELRIPVSGPERLALIKSKYLLTDLNIFFDAGLAWSPGNNIIFDWDPANISNNQRYPVYSTGVSIRINILGALVLEPYYAFPLQNGGFRNGVFGLNFIPGW